MSDASQTARILDPDARFVRLPPPSYDPDNRGVRRGVAPTLSAVGGTLVAASAFGAWLRVTRLGSEAGELKVVEEVLGHRVGPGLVLLVLAVIATGAAVLWNRPALLRRVGHVVTLATVAIAGVALLTLQRQIAAATDRAIADAQFFDLNAGAGWGAWAALVGAAALLLASVFAALAETDHAAPTTTEEPS